MTAIVGLWLSYSGRRDRFNLVLLRSYYKAGGGGGSIYSLAHKVSLCPLGQFLEVL